MAGGGLVSPDGSATIAVLRGEGGVDRLGVLNLTTGGFAELAEVRDAVPAVWSPDGRFVFYVDGGRLSAFERASGDATEVSGELVGVGAIAVRPSG